MYPQSVSRPATLDGLIRPELAPKTVARPPDLSSFLSSLRNPSAPKRSSLRLRPRHYLLLDLLLLHRLLTDTQIAIGANFPLNPNSHYSCQRVLTKLYRNRHIDRLPRATNEPARYLYSRRSTAGLQLLTERRGEDFVKAHLGELGSVRHLLGINDVAVRVRRACWELNYSLRYWQRSQDLEPILRAEQIVPDAYFQIVRESESGPKTSAFFLELQHANRSVMVLRSKLERYRRLYYGGRYEALFGTRSLRVLFVFTAGSESPVEHRVRAGLKEAEKLGVTVARFASLDQLKAMAPVGILTEPIWAAPGQPDRVPLYSV